MRQRTILPIAAFALLTLSAASASATQVGYGKQFGIGAMLGDPSGVTGKIFLTTSNALDFGLGFWGYGYRTGSYCWYDAQNHYHCDDYYGHGNFSTHVDYLWQSNIVKQKVQLDWHVGVGGRIWFWNNGNNYYGHDVDLAFRAPIGLDLMFQNPDFLEVFFELAPGIEFWGPSFIIDWDVGVRFYF